MNMYLVQTVSSRPRPWSSYTNINSKEVTSPVRMNSAEEISKYHDHNSHYCSPVLARRTGGTSYDFPEKSPKKDKKWSLGSLFRRKKKPGSESSSEEETEHKSFLQKKKKKPDKRKRTNKTIGFDHVVVPPSSRRTTLTNGYKNHEDPAGVLSEPSFTGRTVSRNFIPASDFTSRLVPLKDSQDNLDRNGITRSNNSLGSPSVSSLGRRKKEVVKARAQARRGTSKGDDSSDEDSQRSAFKSDESLTKHKDGSVSRRSRTARTQRYLKRRSKDDEGHDQLRACKSDVEHDHSRNVQHLILPDERMQNMKSASKSPILSTTPKSKLSYTNSAPPSRPNLSGLSTIPPSHSSHSKYRNINITNGSLHKQSSSFHDYNDTENKCTSADLNNQRSLSCGANIHNAAPSPENEDEVVHVQFPLGRPFIKRPNMVINHHVAAGKRQPPPPPPRDPRRILTVQNSDGRPISYSFESGYQSKNGSDQQLNKPPITGVNRNFNLNPSCRSTSEDHISLEPSQRIPLVPRPSSATPEANRLHKLGKAYAENGENSNGYRYLADKNPRSRKPICIQSCSQVEDVQNNFPQQNKSQKPFDFWKQKDEEIARSNTRKSTPGSPLMFTAQTHVRTNIFLPNGLTVETDSSVINASNGVERESSPFRPITPTKPPSPNADTRNKTSNGSLDETDLMKRKSSNLEDALDELEAIYNSLHLGDEDLLERAEQREAEAAQKRRDAAFESFPNSVPRGALSDSSFGPNFDLSRRKRCLKRPEPDRKADDMAFRKLNKERYNTISDPNSAVPRVSYMLTSPVFNAPVDDSAPQKEKGKSKEPDVTFDDVVYRNVKHTNNTLKVVEPQPPFGIPIGPILPGSNSDYLHATPEVSQKFTYKPRKIPDVVKDDLAYRNLRKDSNKEPALPQSTFSHEDYLNNNSKSGETLKKKRAVRSLSANIYNLMQRDYKPIVIPVDDDCDSKEQNISDVADALEIARQILKEKEQTISATRKAFMSDGELKYRKFGRSSPTEQRLNFLNEMRSSNSLDSENVYHHKLQVSIPVMDYDRLEAKPPTPDRSRRGSRPSTKESTPIPSSPSDDAQIKKQLQQSTLDELLTSLAVQARETSDRITNELKMYEEEKERKQFENGLSAKPRDGIHKNCNGVKVHSKENSSSSSGSSPEQQKKLSTEKLKELEQDTISASLNLQLSESDSTSEHAKLCEKLMECVVDSTEFLAATKDEPEPTEEVARIHVDPPLPETVANIVLTPSDKFKLEANPVSIEVFSESDHDYVNIQSNDELEKDAETETKTAKDTSNGIETENLSGEVRADSVTEMGSSTEMDEEERELLIDDDTVSADICMSPLEKHKSELVAAFEELRLKDGSLRKIKKPYKDEKINEGIKSIAQTDKGGGEECVSVQYIALPTIGCAFPSESQFSFGDLNREETEQYLNVYNFDFDLGVERENLDLDDPDRKNIDRNESEILNEAENLKDTGSNSEIWINDEDALDSLKSPKLVQNVNTVVTENYGLLNDLKICFNKNLDQSCSDFCDSEQIVLGLGTCLKELENSGKKLDQNDLIELNNCDSRQSYTDINELLPQNLDYQRELDFNILLMSQCDLAQTRKDLRDLMNVDYNLGTDVDKNCNLGQNVATDDVRHIGRNSDSEPIFYSTNFGQGSSHECELISNCNSETYLDSAEISAQNLISLRNDSEESHQETVKDVQDNMTYSHDSYVNNSLGSTSANFSLQTKRDDESNNREYLSSNLRDSRHTLDNMRPSRSWYEDPAVIALACSCGIACTQLSSFDIIAVLGLLFAIISLFIALITRT